MAVPFFVLCVGKFSLYRYFGCFSMQADVTVNYGTGQ